jgi:hypothetical protein
MKQLAPPSRIIPRGRKMALMLTSPGARQRLPLILAVGLLVFVAGCQEEPEIRRYQVPRADTKKEPWRLLGAIIPREKQVWFFRLEGSPELITQQKKDFDQFVKTIRFTGDAKEAIAWKVPEGWDQDKGDSQFRYATLRMGPKEKRLEMTVIPLPREGGADSILKNICRWRDQLGLEPIPDSKLDQNIKNIKVNDVPVTVVDIDGFKPQKKMPRFAQANPHGKQAFRPANGSPFTFKTPTGWQSIPAQGMRKAAFVVGDAQVTVIPLGDMTGKLLNNVNLWREDIKMQAIGEEQLARDKKKIVIAGADAPYFDLIGPKERILAVMVPQGDMTWFFKMKGPNDQVGRQKTAFEEFVRSVKFTDQGN